jgi:hypothetical protein
MARKGLEIYEIFIVQLVDIQGPLQGYKLFL